MTTDTPPAVQVTGLSVDLGGRIVLRGVDLTVRAGEVVAVLGTNGSGKSTLIRTVVGLLPATDGAVRLFGTPVGRFRQWRRVGYVPQRVTATGGVPATVQEVVTSGRLARRRLLRPLSAADRAAIESSLEAVGLADRHRDAVAELSGGQQQRVLIARALAGEPDLLILDEPTSGVDLASQAVFADAVRTLVGRGTTVVLVSHDLGPMDPLIDRCVVLRTGKVAYDGPPSAAHTHAHVHPHGPDDEPPGWLPS
ncbi:MAG TPA: metal ABC transporter ATP-binding protein [Kribbellaceae bacterium]|nr:metal ABC transporter ATP-binding protein [Kribbellaceae bacterium]